MGSALVFYLILVYVVLLGLLLTTNGTQAPVTAGIFIGYFRLR